MLLSINLVSLTLEMNDSEANYLIQAFSASQLVHCRMTKTYLVTSFNPLYTLYLFDIKNLVLGSWPLLSSPKLDGDK